MIATIERATTSEDWLKGGATVFVVKTIFVIARDSIEYDFLSWY